MSLLYHFLDSTAQHPSDIDAALYGLLAQDVSLAGDKYVRDSGTRYIPATLPQDEE